VVDVVEVADVAERQQHAGERREHARGGERARHRRQRGVRQPEHRHAGRRREAGQREHAPAHAGVVRRTPGPRPPGGRIAVGREDEDRDARQREEVGETALARGALEPLEERDEVGGRDDHEAGAHRQLQAVEPRAEDGDAGDEHGDEQDVADDPPRRGGGRRRRLVTHDAGEEEAEEPCRRAQAGDEPVEPHAREEAVRPRAQQQDDGDVAAEVPDEEERVGHRERRRRVGADVGQRVPGVAHPDERERRREHAPRHPGRRAVHPARRGDAGRDEEDAVVHAEIEPEVLVVVRRPQEHAGGEHRDEDDDGGLREAEGGGAGGPAVPADAVSHPLAPKLAPATPGARIVAIRMRRERPAAAHSAVRWV
jgi:hypothetical protein